MRLDKLYPLYVDRAFRSLDRIKPHVNIWWTSGAQTASLLADGQVVMTSTWGSIMHGAINAGRNFELMWDGALLNSSYWTIPKGGIHPGEEPLAPDRPA